MKRRIAKAALALVSFISALAIAEVSVRVLDIPPKPLAALPVSTYRLSGNPVIGYEYRPGYKATDEPYDWSHRGYAINSAGFRDNEYAKAKPEGTYRVIVLGDSTTAGNGIPDLEKTYTKQLERNLNRDAAGDRRYEVLSFGVGGYHTMQEVETLRAKGLAFDPDLVLVTLCLNDFMPDSDGGVYRSLQKRNHIAPGDAGPTFYGGFLRRSRLAFIVHHHLNHLLQRLELLENPRDKWYAEEVLEGRSPVDAGLRLLSELQQEHGFTAIVLILPRFRDFVDEYELRGVHEQIFEIAAGLPGISVIDLLERFGAVDGNLANFSVDTVHLTEDGHRVMGELLRPIVTRAAAAGEPEATLMEGRRREANPAPSN